MKGVCPAITVTIIIFESSRWDYDRPSFLVRETLSYVSGLATAGHTRADDDVTTSIVVFAPAYGYFWRGFGNESTLEASALFFCRL